MLIYITAWNMSTNTENIMEEEENTVSEQDPIFKLKEKLLKSIEGIQENLQDCKGEGHFIGVDEHVLYHGLRKHYTFKADQVYTDLTYSPVPKEYLLVLPSKIIFRYGLHGREINPPYNIETTRFSKLTWANTMQCFLCWAPGRHEIYVAQASFVFLTKIYNDPIVQVMYDEGTKTVIAAGENTITRYSYVLGTRVLQKKDETIFKSLESSAVVITLCILAPEDTGSQRLFISYLNNIYVVNLDTRSLLDTRKNVHSLSITALMLYVPVMWLITGDGGGTVKCWDAGWDLMMVFVGHTRSVLHLVAHPTLCGFVSVGADNTLQVWSCNLRDKVERIALPDAVSVVIVNKYEECLATLSTASSCVSVWYMHLLYSHHCVLSAPAVALVTPLHARSRPCRTLVITADSLVRVISPLTGVQLTVQHVPPSATLGQVTYAPDSEIIYTIINPKGHVLLSYANENPVNFWKVWLRQHGSPQITVLEVYEHIANAYELQDSTLGKSMRRTFRMEHLLVFVGREDGTIASLDIEHGTEEFVTTGHTSSVKLLLANPAMNQLVSCGDDHSIKVWRVFAQHTIEPIILYMSLYYAQTIASIATLREVLCLAVSGLRTITHTVIMYNITEKLRHDHAPNRDHKALIVSMSSSDMLGLCATASQDRTVRIWNEINQLQKVLELNAMPQAMCFSSLQGDITLCIGKHLFKIRHERYLSSKHRYKIALYQIPALVEETPKQFQRENIEVSSESYMRILQPESSLPLLSLGITGDSDKSMEMKRAKAYSRYNAREEDIISIMEGNTVASKRIPSRQVLGLKQWRTLVASITTVTGVTQMLRVAGIKALNIREIRRRHTEKIQHLNLRAKYEGMFGRSPKGGPNFPGLGFDPQESPVASRGFIPNCILYKLLGIERTPPASIKSTGKKHVVLPPVFREREDPEEEGGGDTKTRVTYSPSSLTVSEWHSRQRGSMATEDASSKGSSAASEDEGKAQKDLQVYSMARPSGTTPWMTVCQTQEENAVTRQGVLEGLEVSGMKDVPTSGSKSLTKSPTGKTQPDNREKVKEISDLKSTLESLAAMDLLVSKFILKQPPNSIITTNDFVRVFTNLLGVAGNDFDIVAAMKKLYDEYAQNHKNTMKKAFIEILKTFKDSPDVRRLETFLKFLATLNMIDKDTLAVLLALYIMSQKSIRNTIMHWLTQNGLVDPQWMLEKHLDALMEDVNKQCKVSDTLDFSLVTQYIEKWLTHWQRTLEYHMQQVLQQVRAGELTTGVDSFLVKELERMAERFLKSEQRNQRRFASNDEGREATENTPGVSGDNAGRAQLKQTSGKQNTIDIDLERNTMEMIVLIDDDISRKRMGSVNPVDALNYFCELEAKYNGVKDQHRRRHSESCLKELHLVPAMRGQPPPPDKKIQIPLTKAHLAEPFNDGIYVPHPVLLTLRTSQKYFHPQTSYL